MCRFLNFLSSLQNVSKKEWVTLLTWVRYNNIFEIKLFKIVFWYILLLKFNFFIFLLLNLKIFQPWSIKFLTESKEKKLNHMFVTNASVLFFIISSLCCYRVFITWIFWRLSNLYLKALNLEFNIIAQKHGVFVIIFWLIEWLIKLLILLCYSSIIYIVKFTIYHFVIFLVWFNLYDFYRL